MKTAVVLRIPTEEETAIGRAKAEVHRAKRIPELAAKGLIKLMVSPGREWSQNELMKAFCDASTRKRFGAGVWALLLATPGVVEGPEVVRGGRRMRLISWNVDAS